MKTKFVREINIELAPERIANTVRCIDGWIPKTYLKIS
jgi:hypothetical protein